MLQIMNLFEKFPLDGTPTEIQAEIIGPSGKFLLPLTNEQADIILTQTGMGGGSTAPEEPVYESSQIHGNDAEFRNIDFRELEGETAHNEVVPSIPLNDSPTLQDIYEGQRRNDVSVFGGDLGGNPHNYEGFDLGGEDEDEEPPMVVGSFSNNPNFNNQNL